MNTSNIKSYAPKARAAFIAAMSKQAAKYGITADGTEEAVRKGDVVIIGDRPFPAAIASSRQRLAERVKQQGFEQVMEQVAYSWFNRLCAIRYMELHDYLGHGLRVLSHPSDDNSFQILDECLELDLPGLDSQRVKQLKLDGTQDETLYRELLLSQCHALHQAMPFLFEPLDDETELLLPENLTKTDSLIRKLVNDIPEEDWRDVEIIGWLYQFYISEKKDQVIGKVVKSEDIPAATQLFTPNWIVKYMVQNSLGAQWLATYPNSPLKGQMEYYIEPAEQTDEVNAQLAAITPEALNPEELTLIDPASGSGHILVEAYELFKAIYLERGYRPRDVPQLILEKNLYGVDIDERAAQLTGFALMMKGRADDRRLFERGVKLKVMALVDSAGFDTEALAKGVELSDYDLRSGDLAELKQLFEHATTFGSLIQVPEELAEKLTALKQLSEATSQDLFASEVLKGLGPLVRQAELLAAQYDAVVANPPYMGAKYQTPILKKHLKDYYNGYNKDFFSAFIDRDIEFSKAHGRLGFMSPFVWMFISSHEQLRTRLINKETITSLVQLEYSGFEGATVPICTFTLQKGHVNGEKGCFIRLSDFRGSDNQGPKALEAIQNRDCGWFFEAAQDEFKRIPGSPVSYWVSQRTRQVFEQGELFGDWASPRQGMATSDNNRFLRLWSEVDHRDMGAGFQSQEEATNSGVKWIPYNKGGGFRKWFGNNHHLVNWEENGKEVIAYATELYGSPTRTIKNIPYYYRQCVTWSFVSSAYFGVRYSDCGFIFDVGGSSAFPRADRIEIATAFLCSKLAHHFLKIINPTLNFQSGNVAKLPIVPEVLAKATQIEGVSHSSISASRTDWNAYERSWDFQSLPLLVASSVHTPTLESSYTAWIIQNKGIIAEMKRLEEENNRLFIDAYGLADELTPDVPIEQITLTVNPAYRYGGKLSEVELWTRFREDSMQELVSYAVGCMMGRYSLDRPGLVLASSGETLADYDARLAEWRSILEQSPVDPSSVRLRSDANPSCFSCGAQPGLVKTRLALAQYEPDNIAGRPLIYCSACVEEKADSISKNIALSELNVANALREGWFAADTAAAFLEQADCFDAEPAKPLPPENRFPADDDGIVPLTDTDWFDDDAANRLEEFISVAWDKTQLETNLNFLAENLSPKRGNSSRDTLRRYLCDKFFKDHLQTYKKRPIYWLFSSGKQKAFQCLVYLHRYNESTLARMRTEYVIPLTSKLASHVQKLERDHDAADSTAESKRLEKQIDKLHKQQAELSHFDEKLRHYADQRINLDLDDGVKVNYAKFGDLLAEVKAITGKAPEEIT